MNSREPSTARNMVLDCKSNITKPDRAQVVSRLNQIREYIQQTTSLMDALKTSGDPRQEAQRQKLAGMLEELRDSEAKLQALCDKLEHVERRLEHCERQNISENGSYASSSHSRSQSLEREMRSSSAVRAAAAAKHNELKLMVEESQRKLQALQEHQAALVALQAKAKEQLQQAKAAQESVNASGDQAQTSSDVLQDVQHLQHRLSVLHEIYDNRNQIVELLGERDEALLSEHTVLQDKLTELQVKKRHMDQLLAQFSALSNSVGQDEAADTGSIAEGSEGDLERDIEQAQNTMSELSTLKTQLALLQNAVTSVNQEPHTADKENAEQNQQDQESELAVNLCICNKPDNISSEGERERARDIRNKTIRLQEAKVRLSRLQQLLTTVVDLQKRGQVVPQHFLDELARETASDDGSPPPGRPSPTEPASDLDCERHSVERAPVKEKRTNTQADAQRLQARRRELEQLMRKDQGQSSSINRAEPGYCPTEAASNSTWANSTQLTLDDLDATRAGFSSDDGQGEDANDLPSILSQRNTRSSNSSNNNNKDILNHSSLTNRDALDMCLESHSSSVPIRPSPHNVWRKPSVGSNTGAPRAVWTPSQHGNVPEDGSTTHFPTNHDVEANSIANSNYNPWQNSLLVEQPPASYYQQLWAASQVQQQQALLTTVNQCCHMLWAQQREITSLRAAVSALQQERQCNRPESQVVADEPPPDADPSLHGLPLPVPTPPPPPRPAPALNNQVPPGNRANNYWDNFRSYSRQNLLSTPTKTNDSLSHNSALLTERSRNALQTPAQQLPSSSVAPSEHSGPSTGSCKEKLNTNCADANIGSSEMAHRSSAQERTNYLPANMENHNRHKHKKPPADHSLGDALYSEFSALVAANENQQQFLLQLFENLRRVNSEPLRQGTLHTLQSFLLQNSHHSSSPRSSDTPLQLSSQNDSRSIDHTVNDAFISCSGEENSKVDISGFHDLLNNEDTEDNVEGAVALPPRNAAWNNKDAFEFPIRVGGGSSKLDCKVQSVLVDIVPFVKAHLDDTCSPSLLEAVRELAVQLSSGSGEAHGHLDALLHDALLKFQGCRLKDVGEELLTVIADVVQSELTFLRLVDNFWKDADEPSETPAANLNISEPFPSSSNQNHLESTGADGYNGDLAEADQSCRDDHADSQSHVAEDVLTIQEFENEARAVTTNEARLPTSQNEVADYIGTEAEAQWEADQSLDQIPSRLLNNLPTADTPP